MVAALKAINQSNNDPDLATALVVGATESWNADSLPTHSHERHQLMYAIRGSIHVETQQGSWMLPPSRAIWIRGGTEHSFSAKRTVELKVLYIEPSIMEAPDWQECAVINVTPLVKELVGTSVELPWDYLPDSPSARLVRVLIEQLIEMPRAPVNLPEAVDHRARRVTARLRADPASKETLIELANFAGASPRTLERIFRDETGMSFTEWRHRLRLVEALEKLSEGLAVNQVASAVGYDSTSAFINAFRSHFGTTPGGYFK